MSLGSEGERDIAWCMTAFAVVEEIVRRAPDWGPSGLELTRRIVVEHRDDAECIVPILEMLWPYGLGLND